MKHFSSISLTFLTSKAIDDIINMLRLLRVTLTKKPILKLILL